MRIGIVTTSYPREPGDPAGSFVAGHAGWLAAQGHDVDVIAAGPGGARVDGIAVRRIDAPDLFYRGGAPERLAEPGSWRAAIAFTARVAAVVRAAAGGWERAFAHWLVPSAVAVAVAAPRRVAVTAIAHSGDVHLLRRLGAAPAVAALLAARGARLRFVSAALEQTFSAAVVPRSLARLALRDAAVCPMGIDAARLAALEPAPRANGARPTILFLGRLVPVKGAAVLVDAARRLRHPARVVIAGDGPERADLAARAGDNVSLVGQLPLAERDRALAAADVVVVPSIELPDGRSEGMPLAALEAMAAGVPVVASRVGGLAELPVAALVEPGNPSALAAAIDDVLVRVPEVLAAREFARQLDWSHVGPRLSRLS